MGSSGGGGSSTQTIQKADPWSGVQPYLTDLFSQAQNWQRGASPQFFPESTVVGFSPETSTALDLTTQRALQGSPLVGAAQQEAMNTLGGQYFGASPAFPYQSMAASGGFLGSNPAMSIFGDAATGQLAGINPAYDYFRQASGGDFVGQNPYLDDMFESASDPVVRQFQKATMPGIASMFSAGGRYGSGAMQDAIEGQQDALGRTLSGLSANIYGPAYANERALQQQAAGQLGQLGQQDIQTLLTGAGGLGSLFAGERSLQQQAVGDLSQDFARERAFQQQALGLAPGLAQQDYSDIQALLGVGGARESLAGQELADAIARWDFGENQQLDKLMAYNALLNSGLGFGSQTTTGSLNQARNPLAGALSGAMGGYALGGMLGGGAAAGAAGGAASGAATGSSFGPYGALAGAILGGLFM